MIVLPLVNCFHELFNIPNASCLHDHWQCAVSAAEQCGNGLVCNSANICDNPVLNGLSCYAAGKQLDVVSWMPFASHLIA